MIDYNVFCLNLSILAHACYNFWVYNYVFLLDEEDVETIQITEKKLSLVLGKTKADVTHTVEMQSLQEGIVWA